jgi:hypothetical protein
VSAAAAHMTMISAQMSHERAAKHEDETHHKAKQID